MDFELAYAVKDFGKILKKNHLAFRHILGEETDCMRVYDRNLQAFPVTVELYANYARVNAYTQMSEEYLESCIETVANYLYLSKDRVCFSYKNKMGLKQHEKSSEQPVILTCKENGLLFEVNLNTYTDTGLFLDQFYSRIFIRENCYNKKVLNLFSYTGSFSVYAAAGGAKSVTGVDLSATYTKWAERNLKANGFFGSSYECICSDALSFIDDEIKNKNHYSVIIFDPPSFSNSRKTTYTFDIRRDWKKWIDKIQKLLTEDGFILFSTNLTTFKISSFIGLKRANLLDYGHPVGFKKRTRMSVKTWILAKEKCPLKLKWC